MGIRGNPLPLRGLYSVKLQLDPFRGRCRRIGILTSRRSFASDGHADVVGIGRHAR